MRAFCREKTDRKVVYLTFDDGPHPPETERVLDVLREHGARATFFLIGSNVSGNEAVLRRMLEEGHALGLHTYSHAGTFPLLSFDKMLADVNEGKRAVESVAGKKISLFRPPFGVTNPTIAKVIRTLGLQTVGWDVRSFDTMFCKSSEHSCKQSVYSFKQSEHSCKQSGHSCKQSGHDWYVPVVERIMKQVRPGSVILLHDRLDGASSLLALLLDSLAASGYDFTRALPNTLISSSDSSETNLSGLSPSVRKSPICSTGKSTPRLQEWGLLRCSLPEGLPR